MTLTEAGVAEACVRSLQADPVLAGLVKAGTVPLLQRLVGLAQGARHEQQQQQHLPLKLIMILV